MSLVQQYASERRARLARLGAIPTNSVVSKLTEAQVVPLRSEKKFVVPPVEFFYPNFWCWDLVTSTNRIIPSIQNIQNVVANEFNISVRDMVSQHRTKNLILPRHIALYLAKELTEFSYPVIGRFFGGRDHSTIIHAIQKIEARLLSEPDLVRTIDRLRSLFG
jgi:chromosomal replication initiator protein